MSKPFAFWSSIRSLLRRSKRGGARSDSRQNLLSLESLEDRRVLAVTPLSIGFSNNHVYINGSDADDVAIVTETTPGTINVYYESEGQSVSRDFDKSQVARIFFTGKQGNDQYTNNTNLATTAYGDEGNDVLIGGAGMDEIRGGDGDDSITGGDGSDLIWGNAGVDVIDGNAGDDSIWGGSENDTLIGGEGNDRLLGEAGNDRLLGGAGNDSFSGGDGDDALNGGDGNDNLSGGIGNDVISGAAGDDTILGEAGADILFGNEGHDTLRGGDGDDTLRGDIGNDTLYGDDGNDSINGSEGDDILYGGIGNDNLVGSDGVDRLLGEAGNDRLLGNTGDDLLNGGYGDDALNGGDGIDTLSGEQGSDVISGSLGNDTIYGGEGEDTLFGDEGDDSIWGGTENDTIYGGLGDDRLLGDAGNDRLLGEAGSDSMAGGDGNDSISGGDDNDGIDGGLGNDTISGGAGDDAISGNEGNDSLLGDQGNDNIWGNDGDDLIYGGSGSDRLLGDAGADRLYGEDGDDSFAGGDGDDILVGGNDNDILGGGNGRDIIFGNSGDDQLLGEAGNDVMWGGEGNDNLSGSDGNDVLLGDEGNDILKGELGHDILIGGNGVDDLDGSVGDDILIGGRVDYALEQLDTLLAQWTSAQTYAARIAAIENEEFAAHLMSQHTVFDDYVADTLRGGTEQDWFFVTGAASFYDPNLHEQEHVHDEQPQAHSTGGHHGVNVVGEIPVLEGFALIDALDDLRDVSTGESVHTVIPHADNDSKRTEHISLFELIKYADVTHYAVQSGNWSDPATWHGGMVPMEGARVLVPIGVEVTVDKILAPEIATIRVDGTLSFATNKTTHLKVDTIVVTDVGSFVVGTADNPVAASVRTRITFTDNGVIDRSWDPYGISRGLITHGSVSMYGAAKQDSLEIIGPVSAGISALMLSGIPTGWKVGDKVIIAGTAVNAGQSEERTIRGILGNTIIIDPLQYNHFTATGQSVHIANLTRNIILESEGSHWTRRGHVMFMHNRDVDINYASFNRLGRTNKAIPVNDPVLDADWNLVEGTGINPRARYAVHFHRNGTAMTGTPSVVNGSVVYDNVGWGFVNHSSYVNFTNNVASAVFGAAFVTEVGDEVGSFDDNIAIGIRGTNEKLSEREVIQDHGFSGDGFWFQGAGISVTNNVAADAQGHAFIYYIDGLNFGGEAQYLTSNLLDPSIANGATSISTNYVPVREFSGNVGYSSGTGLTLRYNMRKTPLVGGQSILENSSFWNNYIGVNLGYSESTTLNNLDIHYDNGSSLGAFGVVGNAETRDSTYNNLNISGYYIGIETGREGYSVINGGTFATRYGVVVRPSSEPGRSVLIQGNFQMVPMSLLVHSPTLQFAVDMRWDTSTINGSATAPIDHLFYPSTTILNYGPYQNQEIFFDVQARGAVPFPVAEPQIPSQYVGLTTQELFNQFGLIVEGKFAPSNTISLPNLKGLLAPLV